jgi:hypothetical protein
LVGVIVVDDGSTDRAPQRLRRDPRVQVVANRGRGIPTALNTGIACSTADLVARQDADDESLPGRLAAQVAFLRQHEGIGLVSTGFEVLVRERRLATMQTLPGGLLDKNPVCAGSTVVRRSVSDAAGGYRAAFAFSSDYDMWLRCVAVSGMAILPIVGYRYRLSATMSTIRRSTRQAAYADLARASARARLAGLTDPVDFAHDELADDAAGDVEVNAWWAREFAALGAWGDAVTCLRRLPPRRAARVLAELLPRPTQQAVWT